MHKLCMVNQRSALTKASQKKLCRAISLADLEIGARITDPKESLEWERRMITKYNFKVR